jgi:trehalose 6-phosphate synthase
MVSYDVLLVNPIKDGMNLVAKEGVVVNQNDGILILSQTAGAFHELKDGVIPL